MAEVRDYPLVYHYGDSFDGISWQWKDSAGQAKDLTGYLASLKVKDAEDESEKLHLDSSGQGGLSIPTPANGTVVLNASPTLMKSGSLVEGESYLYDIQVKSSDGSIVKTLTKGVFRVDKQQTDV